jgi:hypothetical protein
LEKEMMPTVTPVLDTSILPIPIIICNPLQPLPFGFFNVFTSSCFPLHALDMTQ